MVYFSQLLVGRTDYLVHSEHDIWRPVSQKKIRDTLQWNSNSKRATHLLSLKQVYCLYSWLYSLQLLPGSRREPSCLQRCIQHHFICQKYGSPTVLIFFSSVTKFLVQVSVSHSSKRTLCFKSLLHSRLQTVQFSQLSLLPKVMQSYCLSFHVRNTFPSLIQSRACFS